MSGHKKEKNCGYIFNLIEIQENQSIVLNQIEI